MLDEDELVIRRTLDSRFFDADGGEPFSKSAVAPAKQRLDRSEFAAKFAECPKDRQS